MSVSAIALAAPGLLLVFAPSELARALGHAPGGDALLQVFGAALLGFAAANWTARGSFLGGIYGRSVVAGNQAHFFIGALVLVSHASRAGGPVALWALCALYVAGAAWFSWLLWGGGPRRSATS
jgi:hypothetical protein